MTNILLNMNHLYFFPNQLKFLVWYKSRFSRQILAIFFLSFFFLFNASASSIPFVDNLCYVRDQVKQINVSPSFSPNDLTFADKLVFNLPSSKVKVSKSLSQTDFTRNLEYLEHENLVTGYVDLPYLISTNSKGTTSLYTMDNKSYSGGWVGSVFMKNPQNITDKAVFTENRKGSIGTKYVPRDERDTSWETKFNSIKKVGFISQYIWSVPTADLIDAYAKEGFYVNAYSSQLIVISNRTTTLYWDIPNMVLTIENNSDQGALQTRVIRKFVSNQLFNVPLMETFITEKFTNFESGDCYQEVVETTYSDYDTSCVNTTMNRESDITSTTQIVDLEVYPNPTTEIINVKIPDSKSGIVEVISSNGEKLHTRRFNQKVEVAIDVSRYPEGMYLIRVISEQNLQYQSKFIKQ